jgi:hypothetical protein
MAFVGVGLLALWWKAIGIPWGISFIWLKSFHGKWTAKSGKCRAPSKRPDDAVAGAEKHPNSTNATMLKHRESVGCLPIGFHTRRNKEKQLDEEACGK